jgi:lipoprotein
MWPELKNVARREARNWLIAAIVAVAYAAMAGSCTPQPAPPPSRVPPPPAEGRRAEGEAAEAAAVYGRMSDQERMRGIVYDPVGK